MTEEVKAKFTKKLTLEPEHFFGREAKEVVRTDSLKLLMDDGWRVCYRLSGTEPVVRVYPKASSTSESEIERSQAMDIRLINSPRVRLLVKGRVAASVAKSAYHAERFGTRGIERIRPAAAMLYSFRRRFATVMVGLLTLWLFVHITFGANGMMVYRSKRAEARSLQKEINSLRTENGRYDLQIENLKTDPKTIEKEAREQLHYARPGEVVYVMPSPQVQETPRTDSAQK